MPRIAKDSLFSEYVKAVRIAKGFTQILVAERTGIPQEEISKIERGVIRRPPNEKVHLLAKALEVPIESMALVLVGENPERFVWSPPTERELTPYLHRLLDYDLSPSEVEMLCGFVETLRRSEDALVAEIQERHLTVVPVSRPKEGSTDAAVQRTGG